MATVCVKLNESYVNEWLRKDLAPVFIPLPYRGLANQHINAAVGTASLHVLVKLLHQIDYLANGFNVVLPKYLILNLAAKLSHLQRNRVAGPPAACIVTPEK